MRKTVKQLLAGTLASVLVFGLTAVAAPASSAEAAKKKPKLSKKKVTVTVKKTKKIKIKNKKGIKKTKWSVKSKKIAKLTKKKKTSVVIKGVKKGKTTVTAKVKVKKKTYKLKLKVTVVKAKKPVVTVKPTAKPTTKPTAKPSTKPSTVPSTKPSTVPSTKPSTVPSAKPSTVPSAKPSTAPSTKPTPTPTPTPSPTPTPLVPEGPRYEVKALAENQWAGIGEEYYSNLKFNKEEGSVFYQAPSASDKGKGTVGFLLNPQGGTVDVSDFDSLEVKMECLSGDHIPTEMNMAKASSARFYTGSAAGYQDSVATILESYYGNERLRVWSIPLSKLVKEGVPLNNLKAVAMSVAYGDMESYGMKVYSFTFVKKEGADYVSRDTPIAVSVLSEENTKSSKLKEGKTLKLLATVTNKNTEKLTSKVNWTSSDDTTATVSEDGVVTGVKAGNAVITATVAGYEKITATYKVEVYDDTPVSVTVQAGKENYTNYTLDELKAGLPVKNVLLNANGDVVGDADDQEITVDFCNPDTLTAVIENGILKVTGTLPASGQVWLIATNSVDGLKKVTKKIVIAANSGYHVPITKDKMYCASPGKNAEDIIIDGNKATVENITAKDSGIGFKGKLPEGKKLSDYSSIQIYASTAKGGALGFIRGALYMPRNGWDTDIITSSNEESANAKLADKELNGDFRATGGTIGFKLTELTDAEKASNQFNFAMGFRTAEVGNISIHEILFCE